MTQDGADARGTDGSEVGSLGEEAARLLGALSGWAREQAEDAEHTEHADQTECSWCPLCQGVAWVRQVNPEVRDHLASAATSLWQAFTALAASTSAAPSESGADPSARGVEDIPLDD